MGRMKKKFGIKGGGYLSVLIVAGMVATVGCTKKVPYDEEYKNQIYSKSLIDTQGEYLYTASMAQASSDDENARPYWFAESKRVKMNITETKLRIEETVLDQRFESNDGNKKIVLEIPIEHIDFECSKNSFGECTNKEQKNSEIDWSQKTNFKLDLADAKASQFEILPILMEKTFSMGFCYQEQSARVVSQDIAADAINFQVERNYKNMCANGNTTAATNVRAVFHYSLVKTSSVLSKGFVPHLYPKKDENTFGFFYTERYPRDIDLNETESGRLALKNHWNPERTVIDYHLSDEFNKPENRRLKELSYLGVERVNKGLKEAGAKFEIKLHDPSGKTPGDIRNSMIVLVENPYAAGPLGYGPQTEDPVTGEIISARTIMYTGVFETIIKVYYEDMIRANMNRSQSDGNARRSSRATREMVSALHQKMAADKAQGKVLADKSTLSRLGQDAVNHRQVLNMNQVRPAVGNGAQGGLISQTRVNNVEKTIRDYAKNQDKNLQYLTLLNRMEKGEIDLKMAQSEGFSVSEAVADASVQERKMTYLRDVKNCAFMPNMDRAVGEVNFNKLKNKFKEQFNLSELKAWENMTRSEKRMVIDFFMEEMWVPTLIHELGHNLGLRHNFNASEDKENFPSKEELAAVQDDREPRASSVMEYIVDNIALKHMGRYDVAALKYTYARKVDLVEYVKDSKTCADVKDDDGRRRITRSYSVPLKHTLDDMESVLALVSKTPVNADEPCGAMQLPNLDAIKRLEARCSSLQALNQEEAELSEKKALRQCEILADLKASGIQELQALQGLQLKDYGFCTDESTGINAGCRRFDVGTTMTEIAQSLIDSYDNRYWVRNFRRDRVDFSLFEDPSYNRRTQGYFMEMRLMMEVVERIKGMGIDYTSQAWQTNDFLKDLRGAAVLTGQKLLDVATTPTRYCMLASKDGQQQFVMPLEQLAAQVSGGDGVDCWEVESELPEEFAVLAQTGKNFNAAKSTKSQNNYSDQIDVRGYWMDKRQAMSMLLRRSVGISNLDRGGENYMDLPELRDSISKALIATVTNDFSKDTAFELADGTTQTIPFAFDTLEHNVIDKPIHPIIARILGIREEKQHLNQLLVRSIPFHMRDYLGKADSERSFANQFVVGKYDSSSQQNLDGRVSLDVGHERFVATRENTIATSLITKVKEVQTKFVNVSTALSVLEQAKVDEKGLQMISQIQGRLPTILAQAGDDAAKKEQLMGLILAQLQGLVKPDLTAVTAEQVSAALKTMLTESTEELITQVNSGQTMTELLSDDASVKLLRMLPDQSSL